MGCFPGKFPGCLESFPENDEIETLTCIQDCYKQILSPYRIKDTLTPTLMLKQVRLTPSKISLNELRTKDFPVFRYNLNELLSATAEIFYQFNLDKMKLQSFLDLVHKNYFPNLPFHNFRHCFNVVHTIFVIGERNKGLEEYIGYQDYLFLLLAALGHDICHPGIDNSYLIRTKHDLALQYNDESVLENHHASVTLMLIRFSGILGEVDFPYLKEIVTSTILSTDISQQKEVCSTFERAKANYNKSKKSSRLSFMNYFIHCADLSYHSLDFSQSSLFSLKLIQEFNQQESLEELLHTSTSNSLKLGNDLSKIKKHQVSLIANTVLPLWSTLSLFISGCEDYEQSIKDNKLKWEQLENFIYINS